MNCKIDHDLHRMMAAGRNLQRFISKFNLGAVLRLLRILINLVRAVKSTRQPFVVAWYRGILKEGAMHKANSGVGERRRVHPNRGIAEIKLRGGL